MKPTDFGVSRLLPSKSLAAAYRQDVSLSLITSLTVQSSCVQINGAILDKAPKANLAELVSDLRCMGVVLPDHVQLGWFGDNPEMAQELGNLVQAGIKTATTGLLWEYEAEGELIPRPSDVEIVVNWEGEILAVVETISVAVLAFSDVDAEFAKAEGEGDGSLEYWRQTHWSFFSRLCKQINREPVESMPVVCERFRLLYTPASAG